MSHAETRRKERLEEVRKFAEDNNIPVQNIQLLNTALTHTSYANEHKGEVIHDNERLEFLGDAVLDLVVGEYLFLRFPTWPEGNLTRAKASAVCKPACAECPSRSVQGERRREAAFSVPRHRQVRPPSLVMGPQWWRSARVA